MGVLVKELVGVIVIVGVTEFVGVFVGVTLMVGVIVGVTVGVLVGVTSGCSYRVATSGTNLPSKTNPLYTTAISFPT